MLQAALCLEHYDISCEVIDLRTLLPWDVAAVGKHARLLNDAFAGVHCCTQIRHMIAVKCTMAFKPYASRASCL